MQPIELKERWETDQRRRAAIAQRCTNEAEAKAAALGQGRDRQGLDEHWHALEERGKAQLEAEEHLRRAA